MNMGEILGWSGGTLLLLMTFVQVAPIKVNPWSGLAKKIGRAINGEVLNEIADIKKEQRETQDKLEKHIQDDDERDASMHRQRILRFNIELMRGEDFTLECFNDMLLDIDTTTNIITPIIKSVGMRLSQKELFVAGMRLYLSGVL